MTDPVAEALTAEERAVYDALLVWGESGARAETYARAAVAELRERDLLDAARAAAPTDAELDALLLQRFPHVIAEAERNGYEQGRHVSLAEQSQTDAARAAGHECPECGHDLDAHTTVTNDGCLVDGCLCDEDDWDAAWPERRKRERA
jgi:hypothetical protein